MSFRNFFNTFFRIFWGTSWHFLKVQHLSNKMSLWPCDLAISTYIYGRFYDLQVDIQKRKNIKITRFYLENHLRNHQNRVFRPWFTLGKCYFLIFWSFWKNRFFYLGRILKNRFFQKLKKSKNNIFLG